MAVELILFSNYNMAASDTEDSFLLHVIKDRTEGQGLNATARTFDISKNTLLNWETKFTAMYKILYIYALAHEFLKLVIEGDEVYTKFNKNVSPDQSSGWTILLMDRASRFIWELSWGKKDKKFFMKHCLYRPY